MRDVYVIGVGHTAFGKFLERSVKSLTAEAVTAALYPCWISERLKTEGGLR